MTPRGKRARVLVAEDDDGFRTLLLVTLRQAGHGAIELEDGAELGDYLSLAHAKLLVMPDLILTDLRMPGASGLQVIRQARANGLACPVVLLTAFPAPEVFEEAEQIGRVTVLGKPIDLDQITQCVNDLIGRASCVPSNRSPAPAR